MAQVEVTDLYKIFGSHVQAARDLLKKGARKDEILEKTGCTVAVNNVGFEIQKGEFFVVMGLSGSGKSTLIRCLNRLIEPTSGRIAINGEDVLDADPETLRRMRRRMLAMVFQNFALFPHRTVWANVAYGLEIQGEEKDARREKAYEALAMVGLKGYEESMPDELSGGMQQRVGLARALATDPEILLMDEAFSALDPLIRTEMQDELLALQSKMHKTIVFITHDLDEALKLGDRIAIMKDGVIVQIGTAEEILTSPADDYVRAFVQDVNRSRVITAGTIMRKSGAIQMPKAGPRLAARRMEDMKISTLFVTDAEQKLKGIVRLEDAVALARKDRHDLSEILIEDVPTTQPETPISDLLSVASTAPFPIAVVDGAKRLKGIIVRAAILAGIGGEDAP